MTESQVAQLNRMTRRVSPNAVLVPFEPGQRVTVTRGGFAGDVGSVRHARQLEYDGSWIYTVTLQSGCLFIGSSRCLKAVEA